MITFVASFTAIALLAVGFAQDDFSIAYIASHSNSMLPIQYKIAAVWGGHQGSMLFWVLILSTWSAFIACKQNIDELYVYRVLQIMALLTFTIALFVLLASNPFELNEFIPIEGRDLNPMLQDIGLIIHPPLLYLGYVGLAATFAGALAAITVGNEYLKWTNVVRPWLLFAWSTLTAGIGLGAWWAYYELGWGGWWFWDPVENASLLPWLIATALIHTFMLSNRHFQLRKWSYALALTAFSFSILGTFIVRSGILTSVHAFAIDANKGIALLLFLSVLLVIGFGVLIWRSHEIKQEPIKGINNLAFIVLFGVILIVVATFTVFLGTFYPMMFELAGLGRISVGAPYFNLLFAPMALLSLIGISIAELKINARLISLTKSFMSFLIAVIVGGTVYLLVYGGNSMWVATTSVLFCWVILSQHIRIFSKIPTRWSSYFAHIGIALVCLGASFNAFHSSEMSEKMRPDISFQYEGLEISYQLTELVVGPNYTAERAHISISRDEEPLFIAMPEKRHYQVRVMNMSEPAINWFWHGDIYITLGEKLDRQNFAVRVQYKAGIRWIWFGFLLVVFAGIIGVFTQPLQEKRIV
jgi:cytochrome c-type biogenesis protein CcmF